ncbi:MAG: MarR family winged helix-turn-helix transcriptional regulator [Clostridia bacterium]
MKIEDSEKIVNKTVEQDKIVICDKMQYHEDMGKNMDLLLFYHLGRIIRPIHEKVKDSGCEFMKLGSVQRNIIGNLYAHGNCTIGELSGFANCSYKNMSKFLEEIESMGIVERYIESNNRRFIYVRITDNGKKLHEDFLNCAYSEAMKLFDEYFTDEEQMTLLKYYKEINKIFSNFDNHRDTSKDNEDSNN